MGELIIGLIIWAVIRAVSSKKRQTQGAGPGSGTPSKRGSGGWADMLGAPSGEGGGSLRGLLSKIENAFTEQEQTAAPVHKPAPKPVHQPAPARQYSMEYRPLESTLQPRRIELSSSGTYEGGAYEGGTFEGTGAFEGADPCHEYMLGDIGAMAPLENAPVAVPAARPVLNFDAPALVQGVIFAEILTRPAQRRRAGTWQRR